MNTALNHTYKLAWNEAQQAWVPVAEHKNTRGKRSRVIGALAAITLGTAANTAFALDPGTLPTGHQITHGQASISQQGNALNIHQQSNQLIAQWDSFNIGQDAQVNFLQPSASSAALNRVLDSNPSQILGQLNANGQVYLINPNGIVFGQTAQVNVGGLIASTLAISDQDFLDNNLDFKNHGLSNGRIENLGQIQARGGIVALIANQVSNQGSITNPQGDIALAAGNHVMLDFHGDGLTTVTVEESVINALAENGGLIQADGGFVIMTTQARNDIYNNLVNNTGRIQAQTLEGRDGKILLLGGMSRGVVQAAGTLDASAPTQGDGGFIETSAASVQIDSSVQVTTLAANGQTGEWLIDPIDFTVSAGSGTQNSNGIGADTLSSNLNTTNVTLYTEGDIGTDLGNINVDAAVTWSAATTLTLNAHNNITINASITAEHADGKLALYYGQSSTNGGTADYFINAPVNLQSGQNFSTRKGINAANLINYTVVNDATALQNMNDDLAGNYAVGSNFSLSSIDNWQPVGTSTSGSRFTGRLDGLGHTLSNLTIDRSTTSYVGLFGYVDNGGVIKNVGLADVSVTGQGNTGGLAGGTGYSSSITNVWVSGQVTGTSNVGGLVGEGAGISHAYSTANVVGSDYHVGGLVGRVTGSISHVWASGDVTGGTGESVGGLVGHGDGNISHAHATGKVTSSGDNVGGLVGYAYYAVSNAYATGDVSSTGDNVGGLSGKNSNTLSNVWASGNVTGGNNVGGLIGDNSRDYYYTYGSGNYTNLNVSQSWASGNVTGGNHVGGLIGNHGANIYLGANTGSVTLGISQSYATGSVSGADHVGGLIGQDSASNIGTGEAVSVVSNITETYASGAVSGTTNTGGLIGGSDLSSVSSSYWDIDTTGQASSSGGGTGINNADAYTQATYGGFDFDNDWFMLDGDTRPFLRSEWSTSITNAHQLQLMAMDLAADYTLANDLDLAPALTNPGGMWKGGSFMPVGTFSPPNAFTGTLNGQGHIIRNLVIYQPTMDGVGLFGYVQNATISHLGLVDAVITGQTQTAGLTGRNNGSAISYSYVSGSVTGTNYVGGLVGYSSNAATVSYSYVTSSVTGTNNVGGLVGLFGGALGTGVEPGAVSYSYATGRVTGNGGGLVGSRGDSAGTVTDSYWDKETTGKATSSGSAASFGKTTAEMTDWATFAGWDSDIWGIRNEDSSVEGYYAGGLPYLLAVTRTEDITGGEILFAGGFGTEENPYTLTNWQQLQNINYNPAVLGGGHYFVLSNALDNQTADYADLASETANNGAGWNPIGTSSSNAFSGSFDGQGYTISNLTINRPTTDHVGLFGYTNNATIQNIGLVNVDITGQSYVGGLVGYNFGSSSNAYAMISNAYVMGSVSGNGNNVGGLVGYNDSNISNAYATGAVTSSGNNAGGLVGRNGISSSISNAYATGDVSSTGNNVGGLVGENVGAISNSFWNTETTGQSTSAGTEGATNYAGKTSTEMQALELYASAGWSIEADNTGSYLYPRLTMSDAGPVWLIVSSAGGGSGGEGGGSGGSSGGEGSSGGTTPAGAVSEPVRDQLSQAVQDVKQQGSHGGITSNAGVAQINQVGNSRVVTDLRVVNTSGLVIGGQSIPVVFTQQGSSARLDLAANAALDEVSIEGLPIFVQAGDALNLDSLASIQDRGNSISATQEAPDQAGFTTPQVNDQSFVSSTEVELDQPDGSRAVLRVSLTEGGVLVIDVPSQVDVSSRNQVTLVGVAAARTLGLPVDRLTGIVIRGF